MVVFWAVIHLTAHTKRREREGKEEDDRRTKHQLGF
jgi:hypothetical protein